MSPLLFMNYQNLQSKGPSNSLKSTFTVQKGQRLEKIATLLKVDARLLKEWNNLTSSSVFVGQELVVYLSRDRVKMPETIMMAKKGKSEVIHKKVLYHYIQKGETLYDISRLYPGVTVPGLMLGNNIKSSNEVLQTGRQLKIKEL